MHLFFSRPFSVLQASRLFRCCAVVCCLLAFWASVDSPAMLIAPASACSTPSEPGPVQQDDDDVIVEQAGVSVSLRILQKHVHSSTTVSNKPGVAFAPRQRELPECAVCEHDKHNGLGAPLLC